MIIIALGANLNIADSNDLQDNIKEAIRILSTNFNIELVKLSPLYGSTSWPDATKPAYINAVASISVPHNSPHQLMDALLETEAMMGRVRNERFAPRVIDLDLILWDMQILGDSKDTLKELVVPHPRLIDRAFVLKPMADIAAQEIIPTTGKSVAYHLENLTYDEKDIWTL